MNKLDERSNACQLKVLNDPNIEDFSVPQMFFGLCKFLSNQSGDVGIKLGYFSNNFIWHQFEIHNPYQKIFEEVYSWLPALSMVFALNFSKFSIKIQLFVKPLAHDELYGL